MNIVIPFRNTCGTKELQMCLKLIRKNLIIEYNEIFVVGDKVDFELFNNVNNIVVEEQKYNKWLDSSFLVQYYIEEIGKPFILFNDDFFLTGPVNNIPYYHYATLEERSLTTNVIDPKVNQLRQSAYGLNILRFIDLFGDFENYEVHLPMIIQVPEIMSEAIRLGKELDCPALKRTLYMKLLKDKKVPYEAVSIPNDCKFGEPLRIMQYPFFSLTDSKEFEVFEDELNRIYNGKQ